MPLPMSGHTAEAAAAPAHVAGHTQLWPPSKPPPAPGHADELGETAPAQGRASPRRWAQLICTIRRYPSTLPQSNILSGKKTTFRQDLTEALSRERTQEDFPSKAGPDSEGGLELT